MHTVKEEIKLPGFEVIDEREKKAISNIFDEGKVFFAHGFDTKRKHFHVREFEKKLKTVFSPQMADALCVSSGTAAIKVALKALGVGKGDHVITQAFNFIATVEAIVDTGASVIFTDVDDTLNMNPKSLERLITKKTKLLIINSPNNPSGSVYSEDELFELSKIEIPYVKIVNKLKEY